ncbi:riboflavin synthase [Caryophanon tenue]|uniref:Riboflavin synthase n=1 Tax=Caryophanon tenue TaxID=33978 RepID=A0A1C0Y786_9BACL|nr:riboflavin synthase [Caryophanon tenue]OCS83020.1 riboflavin synthase subunit alpha [Caryophanon tenue]
MFTGIIEEVGKIEYVQQTQQAVSLCIQAKEVLRDVKLGDSIAVNGVCLTVTSFQATSFTADVMPETVKATNLLALRQGSLVNLERAMLANGRFGGHIVSGHIDGVGSIKRIQPQANAVYIDIDVPASIAGQCIVKGSITLDGTSLTIFDVASTTVTVSLIPHTYRETIFATKRSGDAVNVECDVIGKYVQHFLSAQQSTPTKINEHFLAQHGF